jgi:outer membrane biosynthesis protein TonB
MFSTANSSHFHGRFIQSDQRRMSTALLIAVLFHALLLSVTFGGQTFGLPGFKLPWKERRLSANDLQVMLAPLPSPPAAPAKEANPVLAPEDVATIGSTVSARSPSPSATPLPQPKPAAVSAPAPVVEPVMTVAKPPVAALSTAPVAQQSPAHVSEAPTPSNTLDVAQPPVEQAVQERVALDQAGREEERQRAENLKKTELMAAAQREATRQERLRREAAQAEQAAKEASARLDAERQELARQEQSKQEEKAREEAARIEAIRLEQARQAQLALQRQERARQEAVQQAVQQEQAKQAQLEAQRLDAQRQEALRQEQANQAEKARQAAEKMAQERAADAARQEAAKQEQVRKDQVLRDKARQEAEREERLKAIGRQLDLEAAQRDAASRSTLPSASTLRRGWLFGRADANRDLVLYAEAMSKKIEMNMTLESIRGLIKQPYQRPTVTIAVRSDGTVEKVTFVTSSGVAAIDDAVRKIIASQAPYGVFPPSLARKYDVIEIRRTWIFDIAIRLE